MSGGLDIQSFPANENMEKRLGSQAEYPERWAQYSIMNQCICSNPAA